EKLSTSPESCRKTNIFLETSSSRSWWERLSTVSSRTASCSNLSQYALNGSRPIICLEPVILPKGSAAVGCFWFGQGWYPKASASRNLQAILSLPRQNQFWLGF